MSDKVSIEPEKYVKKVIRVVKDPKTGKVIKKIVKKIPVDESVPKSKSTKKRYANASSGVKLEITNQRLLVLGIVVGAAIILTTATLFFLRTRVELQDFNEQEVIEEESTPAPTAEPIVVDILSVEEITLEILNGSGITGLAGDTADEFADLGYSDVEIGNADEQEETVIIASNDYSEEELENLLDDTRRRLGVNEISEFSDLNTVARIILGSDQN